MVLPYCLLCVCVCVFKINNYNSKLLGDVQHAFVVTDELLLFYMLQNNRLMLNSRTSYVCLGSCAQLIAKYLFKFIIRAMKVNCNTTTILIIDIIMHSS